MKVAITGAAGHLGRALIERLLPEATIERIVALDRGRGEWTDPRIQFVRTDVRDPGIERHLRGCDAFVHLAFIVEEAPKDPDLVESVNVGGSKNAVGAAVAAGIRQIVYASSIAAYGFHPDNSGAPLSEDAPVRGNPEFYYTHHKAEVERWLDALQAEHPDLTLARLRPSAFVGPGAKRALASFLQTPVFAYFTDSGPDVRVHMTHQDDVADAFHLALMQRARGIFNVASDEPLPIRDWGPAMGKPTVALPSGAERLFQLGYKVGLNKIHPDWYRTAGACPIVVSSEKLKRELGWTPRYPTTGAVLRALAGRPTARASRATRLAFGPGVLATKVLGGVGGTEDAWRDAPTLTGAVNLLLTGDTPSEWHARLDRGQVGVYAGVHPTPSATVELREATFLDLLAGRAEVATARAKGELRVSGDPALVPFMEQLVDRFRAARAATGLAGAPRRAFSQLVLWSSGRTAAAT